MSASSAYDFHAEAIDGQDVDLAQYKGHVSLIVNTASKCGFTPQYEGLETLQRDLHARGFNVLAFPCNQFGKQEPGSGEDIQNFCAINYGTTLPLFAKIDVNGENTHPLFRFLKSEKPGILNSEGIKWNFTKFLVNQEGQVVRRYAPSTTPEAIRADIEALLTEGVTPQ